MEVISTLFTKTLALFQTDFTVFGFTMNFWEVFLWSAVAGIIVEIMRRLFFDE